MEKVNGLNVNNATSRLQMVYKFFSQSESRMTNTNFYSICSGLLQTFSFCSPEMYEVSSEG